MIKKESTFDCAHVFVHETPDDCAAFLRLCSTNNNNNEELEVDTKFLPLLEECDELK